MITADFNILTSPKVSIIVPAFNSEKFINTLLDSLIAQTVKDFEVIIVDDGSTDNTVLVIENHLKKTLLHFKLIKQSNSGVSSARNTGMDNACGEFCVFIDSDDFVDPKFIEKLLARQSETDADAVYCGYYHGGVDGYKRKPENFREGNILTSRIKRELLFHLGGVLIRRSFLISKGIKFNNELALGEDLLFCFTILALTNVYAVPDYLYHQQYREDSVMNSAWPMSKFEHNASSMALISNTVSTLCSDNEKPEVTSLLKNATNSAKIKFIWKLLLSGEYSQAIVHLNNNFLIITKEELMMLNRKDNKKYKIIQSKSKIVWSIYFSVRKK